MSSFVWAVPQFHCGEPSTEKKKILLRDTRNPMICMDVIKKPTRKQNKASTITRETSEANIEFLATTDGTTAPVIDLLEASAEHDAACFHFPGHNRGKAAPPALSRLTGLHPFLYDVYVPKRVILDAEERASRLFDASKTWFLVGGTTCGIHASIMATCSLGEVLILPRNSHISTASALVLSGAVPKYIMPEYNPQWDIPGGLTELQIENAVKELEADGKRAAAVFITCPTYQGICSNVREITNFCHSRGIPVIADEAHGAHFRFHSGLPGTALEQGADIAVQSTHKVLSSLTQSSMLHMSGDIVDRDIVSKCLQTLQSSSPSSLLLGSLDAARAQLSEIRDTIFDKAMDLSNEARLRLEKIPGISILDTSNFVSRYPAMDPLRITLGIPQLGISGYMANEILCREHQVIAEMATSRSVTFVVNLGSSTEHIDQLVSGVNHLSETFYLENVSELSTWDAPFARIDMRMSPREAFFAKKMKVRIEESIGKICGELVSSFPPAVPVLVPGEAVTEEALSYLFGLRSMGATIIGAADPHLSSILVCNV